jgi:hypothetical protein
MDATEDTEDIDMGATEDTDMGTTEHTEHTEV